LFSLCPVVFYIKCQGWPGRHCFFFLLFLIAGVTSLVWMSPTQGFYYDGRLFHFIFISFPKIIFTAASSY
jgi:hypothetical protein